MPKRRPELPSIGEQPAQKRLSRSLSTLAAKASSEALRYIHLGYVLGQPSNCRLDTNHLDLSSMSSCPVQDTQAMAVLAEASHPLPFPNPNPQSQILSRPDYHFQIACSQPIHHPTLPTSKKSSYFPPLLQSSPHPGSAASPSTRHPSLELPSHHISRNFSSRNTSVGSLFQVSNRRKYRTSIWEVQHWRSNYTSI